jgi:RNA polymerase sigma-70 factor, ECF subfamily
VIISSIVPNRWKLRHASCPDLRFFAPRAENFRHKSAWWIVLFIVQPAKEMALSPAEAETGGSSRWFETLFREHYPRMVAMLSRLTGDRAQAEEIASDVFCKLSRRETGGDELPIAWLYRVATNAGLDALRKNARRRKHEQAAHVESLRSVTANCALERILSQERLARVHAVLAEMKPRDAQLLVLRADGLAYRELAESLGVQPSSIGTMLARAEAEFERIFRARNGESI